jgi:hypothetical protein
LVYFRLDEELEQVAELGMDRAAVQSLPPDSFLALNRIGPGRLAGRVV